MEYESIAQVIFHSFDDYQEAMNEAYKKKVAVGARNDRIEFEFTDGSHLSFSKDGFMIV